MEKKSFEQELQDKERDRNSRRNLDSKTLENIDENLREQQQMRRKLELDAKLYDKWRHGVDDDNLIYESKSDYEVVDHQLQREMEEEAAKEKQLNLHHERNKTEEKEIQEIRCLQEYHMDQLREQQNEIDDLKGKEQQLKANLTELEKELELLEQSYSVLTKSNDIGNSFNLYKIKILMRNRSEVFRNQIKLCLSILERSMDYVENSKILKKFEQELKQQLEAENQKLSQIECMYESEAKHHLQCDEEIWQQEHKKRCNKLKQFLMEEHLLIKTSLNEIMKKHEEFLEIRATHLGNVANSSEKLKMFIQEEENSFKSSDAAEHVQFSPRNQTTDNIIHSQVDESTDIPLYSPRPSDSVNSLEMVEPHHQLDISMQRNCQESYNNNMSPRRNDINEVSSSFSNLNMVVLENQQSHLSQREIETEKSYAQRSLQVVTSETEADRPRFGRKHMTFN
ncbi:interaptin-like isoform X2 [Lucilia sericata]|uniref:interaptin-like isoform X2 n=1 Tax=Lucilia sericata TaxID=13632 RepID=UPI0018A87177|nr:interaptin-like isoform X2 [Lucilia sericata]XP_037824026.1 interaptin-like isoform X2 [Lucilia sericata]XP_037824027.1 interaptin-like isoform X2 [Lucilia sericata]XP_037824028.1 interaptin-like isoform X2 [Lucilia sericata]XP_037824029.1 interaptin-like isoform X2 [Lucilia sericata]XP_037824031.1 interaptin-like isoform X2 [Lucilia sericata]XP_037824032.1 interaptin-like isoform X2 [Lucilia sericata]XP_037824033.1 interaptin-like isoform X2 [Lucilia sericata]XP_037824034.1 interaptin-l